MASDSLAFDPSTAVPEGEFNPATAKPEEDYVRHQANQLLAQYDAGSGGDLSDEDHKRLVETAYKGRPVSSTLKDVAEGIGEAIAPNAIPFSGTGNLLNKAWSGIKTAGAAGARALPMFLGSSETTPDVAGESVPDQKGSGQAATMAGAASAPLDVLNAGQNLATGAADLVDQGLPGSDERRLARIVRSGDLSHQINKSIGSIHETAGVSQEDPLAQSTRFGAQFAIPVGIAGESAPLISKGADFLVDSRLGKAATGLATKAVTEPIQTTLPAIGSGVATTIATGNPLAGAAAAAGVAGAPTTIKAIFKKIVDKIATDTTPKVTDEIPSLFEAIKQVSPGDTQAYTYIKNAVDKQIDDLKFTERTLREQNANDLRNVDKPQIPIQHLKGADKDVRKVMDDIEELQKRSKKLAYQSDVNKVLAYGAKLGLTTAGEVGVGGTTMAGISAAGAQPEQVEQASKEGFETGALLSAPFAPKTAAGALKTDIEAAKPSSVTLSSARPEIVPATTTPETQQNASSAATRTDTSTDSGAITPEENHALTKSFFTTQDNEVGSQVTELVNKSFGSKKTSDLQRNVQLVEDAMVAIRNRGEELTPESVYREVLNPKTSVLKLEDATIPKTESQVPDWLSQNRDALAGIAEKSGVADKIEDLHAQRFTAKQIADQLGIDVNTVRAVRAARGLPERTDAVNIGLAGGQNAPENPEFTKWAAERIKPLQGLAEAKITPSEKLKPTSERPDVVSTPPDEAQSIPATEQSTSTAVQEKPDASTSSDGVEDVVSKPAEVSSHPDYDHIREEAETLAKENGLKGDDLRNSGIVAMAKAHSTVVGEDSDLATWRPDKFGRNTKSGIERGEIRGKLDPEDPLHKIWLDSLSPEDRANVLFINDHLGESVTLRNYQSAAPTFGAGPEGKHLAPQRAKAQSEAGAPERKAGEDPAALYDKSYLPTSFTLNKNGSIEANGLSPDKLIENADVLLPYLRSKNNKVYTVDGKTNWSQLFDDLGKLGDNHNNGYTFDGQPVQGTPMTPVRPNPDFTPHKIPRDRFEVLNVLLGNDGATLTEKQMATGKSTPEKQEKQRLSELNPYYLEPESREPNRLRDAINKAGDFKFTDPNTKKEISGTKALGSVWETVRPDLMKSVDTDPVDNSRTLRPSEFEDDRQGVFAGKRPRSDFSAAGFILPVAGLSAATILEEQDKK